MKKLIQALPILVALFTVGAMVACKDKGPHLNPEIKIEATLNGLQVLPRNSSTASGRLEGIYNKDTKTFTYTITYSGITPTRGSFNNADFGANGVLTPSTLDRVLASPTSGTWTALTLQQENMLLAARSMYVLLHSTAFPNGEIRGQLFPTDLVNIMNK